MGWLLDSDTKETIIHYMKELGHPKNPYAAISKLVPLTAKQIRHQWNNELDPKLNHDPFTEEERKYIDHWVATNREAGGTINWTTCQRDMEMSFNKLHSTNKIKNAWNSKHNRQKSTQKKVVRKQKQKRNRNRNRIVCESNEIEKLSVQITTTSHQFPVKDDVSHFAQSLLNGIDNIGVTPSPTIIEPKFFQPHAPQLLPNSSEFGIYNNYNNNSNSFTHIPAIQPKFQPYLPTIVMKPIF
ncbi:unnamed protein product [Rhizophagus irregularis]|uniref:HTH myb-type domain-containing protein n=1 Tax=Rhizophagus irregularis TaxID=588596 RepID=A0A2I1GWH8_9GLOM|nr:hypothetical protein RhiirA4_531781 [Rhizophagus irregularis]CAB4408067.1 unnamed protein product [Rhizophagus irregularis]